MKEVKSVEYGLEKIFEGAQDFLPLLGTDYVELYVGNAKQAAHFYKTAFGFSGAKTAKSSKSAPTRAKPACPIPCGPPPIAPHYAGAPRGCGRLKFLPQSS